MAVTLPSRFLYPVAGSDPRIALARTIDQDDEIGDLVERPNYLYAYANRLQVYAWDFPDPVLTTSSVQLEDVYFKLQTDRDDLYISAYGQDADITVAVYNTSLVLQDTTGSLTTSTGSYSEVSATITGLSIAEGYIRVTIDKQVTEAAVTSVRVVEGPMGSSDIP